MSDKAQSPKTSSPRASRRYTLRGKKLRKHLLPFGGGVSECPGNRFARNEIRVFMVHLLLSFDMRLVDVDLAQPTGRLADDFPQFCEGRAGLGIYPPKRAVDFEIRPRQAE